MLLSSRLGEVGGEEWEMEKVVVVVVVVVGIITRRSVVVILVTTTTITHVKSSSRGLYPKGLTAHLDSAH